jgi:ADP-heptose:LPS heptosyltransferase
VNILAIRFARLGDVALLLPALARMKASLPASRLTLMTGHRCAPLARMCPALDDVISVDRVAMKDGPSLAAIGPIFRLVGDIRRRRFDAVVDFHGLRETGLLAWISGARQRLGLKRHGQASLAFCYNMPPVIEDKSLHVSRMFSIVAERLSGAASDGAGTADADALLEIPAEDREWWLEERSRRNVSSYVALYVDAPVDGRVWPLDRFAALGDAMIERFDASVVVLAGPGRSDRIRQYLEGARHPERVIGLTDLPISRLAAVIESACLFVSNDTGPMHLGALCQAPTLGLFSVGLPEHFRPLGPGGDFLKANPIERLELADVLQRAEEMWLTAGSGLRR